MVFREINYIEKGNKLIYNINIHKTQKVKDDFL